MLLVTNTLINIYDTFAAVFKTADSIRPSSIEKIIKYNIKKMKRLFTLVTPKYRHLEGYSQLKQNSLVRMMVMAVAMMMLAPSDVKAAYVTTEYSFGTAANAAYHHVVTDANKNDAQIIMTDRNHNVGSNAKYADKIRYKYGSTTEEFDISRLAFTVNTNGNGKDDNDGYGFYLRRDANNGVKKIRSLHGIWRLSISGS